MGQVEIQNDFDKLYKLTEINKIALCTELWKIKAVCIKWRVVD